MSFFKWILEQRLIILLEDTKPQSIYFTSSSKQTRKLNQQNKVIWCCFVLKSGENNCFDRFAALKMSSSQTAQEPFLITIYVPILSWLWCIGFPKRKENQILLYVYTLLISISLSKEHFFPFLVLWPKLKIQKRSNVWKRT